MRDLLSSSMPARLYSVSAHKRSQHVGAATTSNITDDKVTSRTAGLYGSIDWGHTECTGMYLPVASLCWFLLVSAVHHVDVAWLGCHQA